MAYWNKALCVGGRLFFRMFKSGRGILLCKLAVLMSRFGVGPPLFVLAEIMVMGRLMMMVRSGVVMGGSLMMMLTGGMLGFWHGVVSQIGS